MAYKLLSALCVSRTMTIANPLPSAYHHPSPNHSLGDSQLHVNLGRGTLCR